MENKIGQNFDSLVQRIIYSYAGTFPKFIPIESDKATEHSQEQMYNFMKGIVNKLYPDPGILDLSVKVDDYYVDGELQNTKPKLIEDMRKYKKKIDDFYMLLFKFGELGVIKDNKLYVYKSDIKINSKTLTRLENFGLKSETSKEEVVFWSDEYSDMFLAWKLLTSVSIDSGKNSLLLFSHCMFDVEYSYVIDIFETLLENNAAFHVLRNFFEQNGYKRVDIRENEISLDWVKNYGKKDEPLKASWAERNHGGISIYYDYRKKNQIIYGLRVPKFKEVLIHFNDMDDELKEFVIEKTKKCDGCGYCIQTDKTGTRKPQYITVPLNDEYNLCTLFPGFTYVWSNVEEKTATKIVKLLSFIDGILAANV